MQDASEPIPPGLRYPSRSGSPSPRTAGVGMSFVLRPPARHAAAGSRPDAQPALLPSQPGQPHRTATGRLSGRQSGFGPALIHGEQLVRRDGGGQGDGIDIEPLEAAPPRLARPLPRARSTRIRRMASAAAAKKWPRLFQCCACFTSTRRR
jgi:hypothetical protein